MCSVANPSKRDEAPAAILATASIVKLVFSLGLDPTAPLEHRTVPGRDRYGFCTTVVTEIYAFTRCGPRVSHHRRRAHHPELAPPAIHSYQVTRPPHSKTDTPSLKIPLSSEIRAGTAAKHALSRVRNVWRRTENRSTFTLHVTCISAARPSTPQDNNGPSATLQSTAPAELSLHPQLPFRHHLIDDSVIASFVCCHFLRTRRPARKLARGLHRYSSTRCIEPQT